MRYIKTQVRLAVLAAASSSFAHGISTAHVSGEPAPKEQTEWGVAGKAPRVKRTVALRMIDSIRFEPDRIEVRDGGWSDIVWKFNRVGEFACACLVTGHFEAGMAGRIVVRPR